MRLFPIFFCLLLLFTPTLAKELSSEEIIALVEQSIQESNNLTQIITLQNNSDYCSASIDKIYNIRKTETITGTSSYSGMANGAAIQSGAALAKYLVPQSKFIPTVVILRNLMPSDKSPSMGIFSVTYKIPDSYNNCNIIRYSYDIVFSGRILKGQEEVGSWGAAATKYDFYLYATYNQNISTVNPNDELTFVMDGFSASTPNACWVDSPWVLPAMSLAQTKIVASDIFDRFNLIYINYYVPKYTSLTNLGRMDVYSATMVVIMPVNYTVNFTLEYFKDPGFLKLTASANPNLEFSFDNVHNVTAGNVQIILPPEYSSMIVRTTDRDAVFDVFKIKELLPCYLVNVTTTLVFKNSVTGEDLSGVNLLLTRGYNFNGVVSSNFSFVALSGSIVDYVAKKEGYKIATGSIQITDDRVVEILLEPETYGDAQSNYVTEVKPTKAKINEPIIVKIKNTAKAWWNPFDPEWIEGAEIYVDGNPTGITTKKPVDDSWGIFSWLKNWLLPGE
ncbi:MAG: hypothetical protein QW540_09855, partial [Archaeoglobaceae archaeon]